jgi:hypothetical protein
MTRMVNTLLWRRRGCALLAVTAFLGGCARVTPGTAEPMRAEDPPVPVADLLIGPDRFPVGYPGVVLDATAVYRALQDIDGVPRGSVVTPGACAPVPLAPEHTAAAQGTDTGTFSVLLVTVNRPAPPLSARMDQLRGCPSFNFGYGGDVSTVTVSLLPAPPVDADDRGAIDQTVTSVDLVRRTLTFLAQIGDTRVSATWLQVGPSGDPDTASLDAVFSDAVLKVRRGG